jgi:hypothetical protein
MHLAIEHVLASFRPRSAGGAAGREAPSADSGLLGRAAMIDTRSISASPTGSLALTAAISASC